MDPDDENGIDDDGNGYVDDLIGWDFREFDNDPWYPNYSTHGSPTASILVGDGSSGKQTGVAPGAKLMVIRVSGSGAGEVSSWNALQYAVDNGAQIASLSYGWYHRENPDRVTWRELFDNITHMGLIPFVAVGNNKGLSPPEDVATPADTPAAIGVGATDCGDLIASYSSQGPSSWSSVHPYNDYPYLLKPNITAPAEPLDPLDQCSGYASFNGTSAAAPHAAGVTEKVADALVDDVMVIGKRVICDSYTPTPAQTPNGIGTTLRLALDGDDIKLTWLASPVDATHDPATLYRIRRDDEANGPFDDLASATGLFAYDLGEATDSAPTRFYIVIAENAGGGHAGQ